MTENSLDQRLLDATLDAWVGTCTGDEVAALHSQRHAHIRTTWRRKSREPVDLACGVVAVEHQT